MSTNRKSKRDRSRNQHHIEAVEIEGLKPYPSQAECFGVTDDTGLEELAADMKAVNQRDAIHILPNHTIIIGHRRVAAATLLGWKHINAIVRHDIADDKDAVEALFISDNFHRRQLTPLQQARCADRLWKVGRRATREPGESIANWIGRQLGMTGHNARRYLNVFDAPASVQQAFDSGHLNLVMAAKVGTAHVDVRRAIEEEIQQHGIEHSREIAKRHINSQIKRGSLNNSYRNFVGSIRLALEQLPARVAEINTWGEDNKDLWREAKKLISLLAAHEKKQAKKFADDDDSTRHDDIADRIARINASGDGRQ